MICSFLLFTIKVKGQTDYFKPQFSIALETKAGKESLKQCSRCSPRNASKIWKVDTIQIKLLEDNFKKVIELRSWNYDCIRDLSVYAFQYVGLTLKKRKYIYINAFRVKDREDLEKRFDYWKTDAIVVCDGGGSFWGVLFDIEKLDFSELCMNGHA